MNNISMPFKRGGARTVPLLFSEKTGQLLRGAELRRR